MKHDRMQTALNLFSFKEGQRRGNYKACLVQRGHCNTWAEDLVCPSPPSLRKHVDMQDEAVNVWTISDKGTHQLWRSQELL